MPEEVVRIGLTVFLVIVAGTFWVALVYLKDKRKWRR